MGLPYRPLKGIVYSFPSWLAVKLPNTLNQFLGYITHREYCGTCHCGRCHNPHQQEQSREDLTAQGHAIILKTNS
jgi:hypothetical protein